MDDEVILCFGSHKVLLTPEEAFRICEVVNGSSQITGQWSSKGGKNGQGGSLEVIAPPSSGSFMAYVVPMTGHMRLMLDTNEKILREESR